MSDRKIVLVPMKSRSSMAHSPYPDPTPAPTILTAGAHAPHDVGGFCVRGGRPVPPRRVSRREHGHKHRVFSVICQERSMTRNTVERYSDPEIEAAVARVEAVSRIMDSLFEIPGTKVRVGLDAVIGIVPVVGDLLSQIV